MNEDELREQLADLQHQQWSDWMEYLFSISPTFKVGDDMKGDCVIPAWAVERWVRQMRTKYAELPEDEKESDRIEADKYLPIIHSREAAAREEGRKEMAEAVKEAPGIAGREVFTAIIDQALARLNNQEKEI